MPRQKSTLTMAHSRPSPRTIPSPNNGPHELMRAALGFSDITVDIPENATLKQVEDTLQLAITGYRRLSEASERLKPIIGRILLTVQQRNLFKPEYKNFTTFLMERVVVGMGLGRSHAFDSLRIARAFPSMTTEEYSRYGASKLLIAARLTDETQEGYKETLKELAGLTVEEGKAKVRDITAAAPASSYTVSIRVSPEIKGAWQELMEAVEMAPGDLFGQMIENMRAQIATGYTTKKPVSTARKAKAS